MMHIGSRRTETNGLGVVELILRAQQAAIHTRNHLNYIHVNVRVQLGRKPHLNVDDVFFGECRIF